MWSLILTLVVNNAQPTIINVGHFKDYQTCVMEGFEWERTINGNDDNIMPNHIRSFSNTARSMNIMFSYRCMKFDK